MARQSKYSLNKMFFAAKHMKSEKREGLPVCVSAIIPTYNHARMLKRTLYSLSRQTLSPNLFEVIVVDDGSRDNTQEVCSMMRSKLPNLKYISTGCNAGSHKARNRGLEVSSGNYILFTDDDCIPSHDWIERMIAALDHTPIVAGAVVSTTSNYFRLCHNISQFHAYMPGQKAGYIEFIAGANMGFERSVLEELKGFQKCKYAEDMNLVLRAREKGYRPFFMPDAVVTHDPDRTTLGEIMKYAAMHATETICLRNEYRRVLKTPFILRSPLLILLTAPIIASKVTASIYFRNLKFAKFLHTLPVVFSLKLAWCWGAAKGLRKHISKPLAAE
jgi:cellulose synthase/poly-beta-1,6-N-acetylglucosamine synthase-like glycosyltransferase